MRQIDIRPHHARSNALATAVAVGMLTVSMPSAVEAHSIFVKSFDILINDIVEQEFNPHDRLDEKGNFIPIPLFVAFGESASFEVRDNIGCKALIGVAQASTFLQVVPTTTVSAVLSQEFTVTAKDGGEGQANLPLTIGWEGDGSVVVFNGEETACDETAQAVFAVTLYNADGTTSDDNANTNDNENQNDNANNNAADDNVNTNNTNGSGNTNGNTSARSPCGGMGAGTILLTGLLMFALPGTTRRRR